MFFLRKRWDSIRSALITAAPSRCQKDPFFCLDRSTSKKTDCANLSLLPPPRACRAEAERQSVKMTHLKKKPNELTFLCMSIQTHGCVTRVPKTQFRDSPCTARFFFLLISPVPSPTHIKRTQWGSPLAPPQKKNTHKRAELPNSRNYGRDFQRNLSELSPSVIHPTPSNFFGQ